MAIAAALAMFLAGAALSWLVSWRFAPRLLGFRQVVMSWGFDRRPNRADTPRVALMLTPTVATATLALLTFVALTLTPADERFVALSIVPLAGAAIAAIHFVHLSFAVRAGDQG